VIAVISDSSPLNYLALLDDFDLLHQVFGTLIIPPAVYCEVVVNGSGYPVQTAVRAALGNNNI
jgi:predicted nucleic acid-binding protein